MQQPLDVPKISSDKDRSIKELRNYVIDLTEYLKYKLNHLEIENFTETDKAEIRAVKTQPPAVVGVTNKYVLERITEAIEEATALITGHEGGYVVLNPSEKPEEILIMDSPNIETAQNVWRWNGAGLGFSSNGYDGTYNLAMTMNGAINASFITTGSLVAIDITGSTITGGEITGAEITGSIIAGSNIIGGGFFHCPTEQDENKSFPCILFPNLDPGVHAIILLEGDNSYFPVNSYVDIGSFPYGNDRYTSVKILGHYAGSNQTLIINSLPYANDVYVTPTNLSMRKPFSLYAVPIEDYDDIDSYESKMIGGIDYVGGEVRLYAKEWTVSGSTTVKPSIKISSPQSVTTMCGGVNLRFSVAEFANANNFRFYKNGKTYEIDPNNSVGIGQPALIRTS